MKINFTSIVTALAAALAAACLSSCESEGGKLVLERQWYADEPYSYYSDDAKAVLDLSQKGKMVVASSVDADFAARYNMPRGAYIEQMSYECRIEWQKGSPTAGTIHVTGDNGEIQREVPFSKLTPNSVQLMLENKSYVLQAVEDPVEIHPYPSSY